VLDPSADRGQPFKPPGESLLHGPRPSFRAREPCSTAAMGKADDMRRQRELRYEQDQREDAARRKAATASAAAAPAAGKAAPVEKKSAPAAPEAEVAEPEVAEATEAPKTKLGRAPRKPAAGTAAAADRGTCSVCLKPRPLKNGLVASHQKGFGKVCTGSRKPPT